MFSRTTILGSFAGKSAVLFQMITARIHHPSEALDLKAAYCYVPTEPVIFKTHFQRFSSRWFCLLESSAEIVFLCSRVPTKVTRSIHFGRTFRSECHTCPCSKDKSDKKRSLMLNGQNVPSLCF